MDLSKIAQNLIKCVSTGEVRALTVSESILETNFFTIVKLCTATGLFEKLFERLLVLFRRSELSLM